MMLIFILIPLIASQLTEIDEQIFALSSFHIKLPYILTKIDIRLLNINFTQINTVTSSTIYSKSERLPLLVGDDHHYYTIEGQTIANVNSNIQSHFISFIPGELTYIAQIQHDQTSSTANVFKIIKGPNYKLQLQHKLQYNSKGQIVDFLIVAKRSKRLSMFITDQGKILTFDGKTTQIKPISFVYQGFAHLLRINIKILLYTSKKVIILSTLGEFISECIVPVDEQIITVKYDDENLKTFYLKTQNHLYIYYFSQQECKPIKKYKIYFPHYDFWMVGFMLVIQSDNNWYYIDAQNDTLHHFQLPENQCTQAKVQIHRKMKGEYMLSRFCRRQQKTEVESYMIIMKETNKPNQNLPYEKMRIPMIIICFGIIIYMTKNKEETEEK